MVILSFFFSFQFLRQVTDYFYHTAESHNSQYFMGGVPSSNLTKIKKRKKQQMKIHIIKYGENRHFKTCVFNCRC